MLFPLLTVQKTFVSTPFGYLSRRLLHKTYYEVLGLTRNCTIKDIKSAYITLSKKFHPDNNTKDASHKEFLKISEAYNVLSKPDKRRLYDWELERQVYQKSFNSRPRPRPPPRSPRSPFEDEFIWRRYQSHNDHDNYYGVPGVKRLSNGVVAWFCVFFTVICATIQFYAIRHSYYLREELFQQRTKENEEILSRLNSKVNETDRETQIGIVEARLKANGSRFR